MLPMALGPPLSIPETTSVWSCQGIIQCCLMLQSLMSGCGDRHGLKQPVCGAVMLPTATVFVVRLCHGLKQPACGVVRTSYNAAYGYSL